MKKILSNHKDEILIFLLILLIYSIVAFLIFSKTSIFYNTNNTYDILLDTDTGVLFNRNTFAIKADNSKHILFNPIVSLLAYPIYLLSQNISNIYGISYINCYGLGLTILQILVSTTSILLIYNCMKNIKVRKSMLIILTVLMTLSFPQLFMTLSIERFIYAQLSLIFFVFLVSKIKNQDSYIIDLAAIPLIGITTTNIYLYFMNILLQYKLNVIKILKHIGIFFISLYIIIIATKSYVALFLMSNSIQTDSSRFIPVMSLLEKLKFILTKLLYPALYFPGYKIVNKKMIQVGANNKLFLFLMIIILLCAIIGGIKNFKKRIPKLCLSILLINFILHGIIGYNLINANIMTIHFSFAIILLLSYFSKSLNDKQYKIFIIFLAIVLGTVIISNIYGFKEILNLGMQIYPK